MEARFICPDCRAGHDQPGDARLGHRVPCLDCSLGAGINEPVDGIMTADEQLAA